MGFFSRELFRRIFIRDRIILYAGLVAAALWLVMTALVLWRGIPLRNQALIPLHYTIYFGIDYVGPWYGIFYTALFGLVMLIMNAALITALYERYRLVAYFFAIGTALMELLLLVSSVFIVLLNV